MLPGVSALCASPHSTFFYLRVFLILETKKDKLARGSSFRHFPVNYVSIQTFASYVFRVETGKFSRKDFKCAIIDFWARSHMSPGNQVDVDFSKQQRLETELKRASPARRWASISLAVAFEILGVPFPLKWICARLNLIE